MRRVAFDEHISNEQIGSYVRQGYIAVYVAPHGTPDEIWIDEAIVKYGAEIIVSRDYDVPNYLDKQRLTIEWRPK